MRVYDEAGWYQPGMILTEPPRKRWFAQWNCQPRICSVGVGVSFEDGWRIGARFLFWGFAVGRRAPPKSFGRIVAVDEGASRITVEDARYDAANGGTTP